MESPVGLLVESPDDWVSRHPAVADHFRFPEGIRVQKSPPFFPVALTTCSRRVLRFE
ncbi:hypothetical protein QKD39_gp41 [Psittacine adenovirus 1]|uniref:Uncharacterized protein n=1 Tax=Psittacine adenovirus 1 TaxID=318592 RepID=A0A2Z5E1E1_9ADEN|nr:hypothetical protein QKD39_gp41 [Psittacine adenovirus 1]AXB73051.1 hypothetical protein [Psittacine adenovirus 1]